MDKYRKLFVLASMVSVLGVYGCDSDDLSECDETYTPTCFNESTQLRCGANGMIYHKQCALGCVMDPARGSVCKGEDFCSPKCEPGYYCDYDTCRPTTGSQCEPACASNEICLNNKCRIPGTCDTKADCNSEQDCIGGYCVNPEVSCTVTGCAADQTCNATTGKCEPKTTEPECSAEKACTTEGMVCDLEQGKCVPETKDCTVDGCPTGYTCNEETKLCDADVVEPECSAEKACTTEGMVCDLEQGKCVPATDDCTVDGCPTGYTCNGETKKCDEDVVEPECSAEKACTAEGMTCDLEQGKCVPATDDCTADGCPTGYTCNEETKKCEEDVVEPECSAEKACTTEGMVCDLEQGKCVPEKKDDAPEVVSCGTPLTVSGSDECEKTGSGNKIILRGDVLALDKTYEGGSVVIEDGKITYVGCEPEGLDSATVITCPNSVISPATINGHEHLTYSNAAPRDWGEERFDHRHEWRVGKNGHKKVPGGGTDDNMVVEVRAAMAGTASIFGSIAGKEKNFAGLVRNIDYDKVDGVSSKYQTFPLGDSDGTMLASGCGYSYHNSVKKFDDSCPYGPHIAEGIDQEALNELRCLSGEGTGSYDIFKPNTAVIHGIAATPDMVAKMAENGMKLIWSPRTNISLYGDTAQVTMYDRMGVIIGLGTDWIYSGSANMQREFACIDYLNKNHYGSYFTDFDLWKMPTYNNAIAFGVEKSLGQIKAGLYADITMYRTTDTRKAHRAVIEADNGDILLVMINGNMVYGNANLMDNGDAITVCEEAKKFDLTANGPVASGLTFASIQSKAKYPLFFCEENLPKDEPTCIPSRTRKQDTDDQQTTNYSGMISEGNDSDGDGIADSEDNCPTIFNPVRSQYTDRKQTDYDEDGLGDACDPFPACKANDDTCSTVNPYDKDGDGINNSEDNCPDVANADQKDTDNDGIGDDCDACPDDGNNEDGKGCSLQVTTIKTIRDNHIAGTLKEESVKTQGVVTAIVNHYTAEKLNGFIIQDETQPAGVYVYSAAEAANVKVGDLVTVFGDVKLYNGLVEIEPSSVKVVSNGHTIAPTQITAEQATSGVDAEKGTSLNPYDSVLVYVPGLTIQSYDTTITNGNAYLCTDASGKEAYIDDFVMGTKPFEDYIKDNGEAGTTYDVTGILIYDFKRSKIAPRSTDDIISGFGVKSLVASTESADWGSDVEVTLTLSKAADAKTTVAIACGNATCPSSVDVAAGETTAKFTVTMAASGDTTVTATYDGKSREVTIKGVDPGMALAVESVDPETLSISPGKSKNVTVTLNKAASEATNVTLSSDNTAITVPANVEVAAGASTAEFSVAVADDATIGATGTVSVVIGEGTAKTVAVTVVKDSWDFVEDFEGIPDDKIKTGYNLDPITLTHDDFTVTLKGRTSLDNSGTSYAINNKGVILTRQISYENVITASGFSGGVGKVGFQWRTWGASGDDGTLEIIVGDKKETMTYSKDDKTPQDAEFTFNSATATTIVIHPTYQEDKGSDGKLTNKSRIIIDNVRWTTAN